MTHKYTASNGLRAVGLGLIGGMLLWWGLRRRPVREIRRVSQFNPAESPSRTRTATPGRAAQPRVSSSISETAWTDAELPKQPQGQEPARGEALADIAGSASSGEGWQIQSWATELEAGVTEETAKSSQAKPAISDDLTPIEGIGPKINQILHEAGITTFAQLAGTQVSQLQQILSDANIRLANADTWPEQAQLAAAGDWEGLKRLQDELDAGVRRSG